MVYLLHVITICSDSNTIVQLGRCDNFGQVFFRVLSNAITFQ